jgi:hypothetical protein
MKKLMDLFLKSSQKNTKSKMEQVEVMEDKQVVRYQWIKGEKFGNIQIVADEQPEAQFIYFTDGTRIFKNVLPEFLIEVKSDKEVLKTDGALMADDAQNQTPTVVTNTSTPVAVETVVETPTVMGNMIMKMSKKNVVQIPINININIPTPSIYGMLLEGMEEQDLQDEITKVALQQIEINKLQDYIKENVNTFLSDYYSDN